MVFKIPVAQIYKQLIKQLTGFFFLSKEEKIILLEEFENIIQRCELCFSNAVNKNKYYWIENEKGSKETYFNPYHSGQYTIFLYYASNSISKRGEVLLADKLYYLNKIMNGCDLYHQINLPSIFFLDHPVGSVMGRAIYNDNFTFGQNCTVGNNKGIYPTIGKNVRMCANSSIIGNCHIGNNVVIGANSGVKDENVPSNSIVFGQSPTLIIKSRIK